MKEIWKDIYFIENGIVYDYRGLYQVSDLGRIKSLTKTIYHYNGYGYYNHKLPEKILTPVNRNGYNRIRLYKNKKYKTFSIHKLVALMFIPNPENKPQINHINGIKKDNRAENLEWCTGSENCKHAWDVGLKVVTKKQRECGRKYAKLNFKYVK